MIVIHREYLRQTRKTKSITRDTSKRWRRSCRRSRTSWAKSTRESRRCSYRTARRIERTWDTKLPTWILGTLRGHRPLPENRPIDCDTRAPLVLVSQSTNFLYRGWKVCSDVIDKFKCLRRETVLLRRQLRLPFANSAWLFSDSYLIVSLIMHCLTSVIWEEPLRSV